MGVTFVEDTLKVEAVSSKFGNGAVKVGDEWINFNDKVGIPVTDLEKGGTYKFQLAISEKGKRYINKVLSLDEVAQVVKKTGNGSKSTVSKTGAFDKDAYYTAKNDSMKIGGLFHDAATVVSSVSHANIKDALKDFDVAIDHVINVRKKFD